MTLPEQSDRAVAQTRAFLLRLASPYGEHGIKGIRREVRAEALALLRHYPRSYAGSDEKRSVSDMDGATVHPDCTLTTARIECNTSLWIPVSERLPEDGVDVIVASPSPNSNKLNISIAAIVHDGYRAVFCEADCGYVAPTHWMPLPAPREVSS